MIVSQYVVYHNTHRNLQYEYHDIYTMNYCQSRCLQSSDRLSLWNHLAISSAPPKPFLCLLGSESPISKYLRKVQSLSVVSVLAELNIPLADVFALDNFSAHIISSNVTSVPAAIDLQIPSNRRR